MGRSRPAGFALITTMLMIVLVVMLVGSVVSSSLGDWRLAHSMLQRETALMAANSGTQYAFTRLQQDIYWRANPSQPYHLQGERYEIWESQGNVVGKLVAPYGETSFFRFKFNYEDGPGEEKTYIFQPIFYIFTVSTQKYSLGCSTNGHIALLFVQAHRVCLLPLSARYPKQLSGRHL